MLAVLVAMGVAWRPNSGVKIYYYFYRFKIVTFSKFSLMAVLLRSHTRVLTFFLFSSLGGNFCQMGTVRLTVGRGTTEQVMPKNKLPTKKKRSARCGAQLGEALRSRYCPIRSRRGG
jgi:hypothetical protein